MAIGAWSCDVECHETSGSCPLWTCCNPPPLSMKREDGRDSEKEDSLPHRSRHWPGHGDVDLLVGLVQKTECEDCVVNEVSDHGRRAGGAEHGNNNMVRGGGVRKFTKHAKVGGAFVSCHLLTQGYHHSR